MGSQVLHVAEMLRLILLILGVVVAATLADFECPENEGIFPDPDDCRSFYQCVHDRPPFHEVCPTGTLFDDIILVCNYEDQVDCGDRPIIDGPTTTQGPTDPTTTTMDTTTNPITTTTVEGDTTTTAGGDTTTTSGQHIQRFPEKVMGFYILLADDYEEGFDTNADWEPELYDYQIEAANVLFFTFINPETMVVPKAFEKLALSGTIPDDTIVLFAIGGYAYSVEINPWPFLTSKEAAEAMADEVATWLTKYGIDGIDMDIEEGAGSSASPGPNLGHFIRRLRELEPDIIIGQPSYGYPQVQAANDVINLSWNVGATSN